MSNIKPENEIRYICDVIDKNIEANDILKDRGLLSENILSQLRNLVEDSAILINNRENSLNLDSHYDNVRDSMSYVSGLHKYKYINNFHESLQKTVSHYTPNEGNAERLMLYYFRYICMLKNTLKEFGLMVLKNLDKFPIYEDELTKNYYLNICKKIDEIPNDVKPYLRPGRFYVNKCKTIYAYGRVYFEVTLTKATNYTNKFERILMYSREYIPDNYSIKVSYVEKDVRIFSYNSKIRLINNYVVSIRPCELKNVAKILGEEIRIEDSYKEYGNVMKIIKDDETNLLEIVLSSEDKYMNYLTEIREGAGNYNISNLLSLLRKRLKDNLPGNNVLRYILVKLENVVIRDQYESVSNSHLGGLYLRNKSIPFDSMPYAMSLYNHNVSYFHLINAIDDYNRDEEKFAKHIKDNSELNNKLYTDASEVEKFGDLGALLSKYNRNLMNFGIDLSGKNSIKNEHNLLYINSYESNSIEIIKKMKEYMCCPGHEIIDSMKNSDYSFEELTSDKIELLGSIFDRYSIALIHGPAGTGKTKMLEVLAYIFKNFSKLFLSNTNTSVENLRKRISKVDDLNSYFKTTASYNNYDNKNYDILIIDECSTVSNMEMLKILNKQKFKIVILSGDVFQIESIKYGNWFSLTYNMFKKDFVYELLKNNRTDDEDLKELWKKIRDDDEYGYEKICNKEYSSVPDETIFTPVCEDEVILCLNYDGPFGINNINKLLQDKNYNNEISIGIDSFKIDDHIIFNDCPRFKNLYNNLKGIIKNIELDEENDKIWFTILVYDAVTNDFDSFEILNSENNQTLVKFYVKNFKDTNEDDSDFEHIIPFSLSYALSIHKAQGLEYDSVKIIITSNVDDRINKNIFYTAITRAKKYLKIFWSSESQKKIFEQMQTSNNTRDISILKGKINKEINKN